MRILISGGAGFIGSTIARSFQEKSGNQVVVLDNLRRRGSELNLISFKKMGIEFYHGDVREPNDLLDIPGSFDLMVEASAEPSVQAGQQGSPAYVIGTNLQGTINCLEYARKKAGLFAYLSTSRVYSISSLRAIQLDETPRRFEVAAQQILPGISERGIDESFPTNQARSLYGATKLASELLIQEYVDSYGMKAIVNRCGVIAGPGQFGKTDQGVISLWVANHYFGLPLNYKGFGGKGKQVRDVLHPLDLVALLSKQIEKPRVLEWGTIQYRGRAAPIRIVAGANRPVPRHRWAQRCDRQHREYGTRGRASVFDGLQQGSTLFRLAPAKRHRDHRVGNRWVGSIE